jgi:hypothetical protein
MLPRMPDQRPLPLDVDFSARSTTAATWKAILQIAPDPAIFPVIFTSPRLSSGLI